MEKAKVYNEGLDKTYECYVVDGVYYFTKDEAKLIAVDCYDKAAGIEMFYDKKNDSFVYVERDNFEEGYHVEYKGEVIYSNDNLFIAYPIGYDWTLWDLRKGEKEMIEKVRLKEKTIELNRKTRLGVQGQIEFTDGYRLVIAHETNGFGEDLKFNGSLEKAYADTPLKGMTRYEVIESFSTKTLNEAQDACNRIVDSKFSEGVEIAC